MENIRDIKKHLRQEDYAILSKITGYSSDYIKNCIQHRLNNRLIVKAARIILSAHTRQTKIPNGILYHAYADA